MEHEQIAAQVKKLTGKNNDAAYAALCTLEAESEASAAVCVFWDAFAAMLDDKRTYVRMRGMVLLACNAQWAGPEQVMEMLERYLAHITDEKAAAARWCVEQGLMKRRLNGKFAPGSSIPAYQVLNAYRKLAGG